MKNWRADFREDSEHLNPGSTKQGWEAKQNLTGFSNGRQKQLFPNSRFPWGKCFPGKQLPFPSHSSGAVEWLILLEFGKHNWACSSQLSSILLILAMACPREVGIPNSSSQWHWWGRGHPTMTRGIYWPHLGLEWWAICLSWPSLINISPSGNKDEMWPPLNPLFLNLFKTQVGKMVGPLWGPQQWRSALVFDLMRSSYTHHRE